MSTAPLSGLKALVTGGPTYEAIDPVRYIGNRASGKQGHAIAAALARQGADTLLVVGPTWQPDPPDYRVIHVESAREMRAAVAANAPYDIVVCNAAVADYHVVNSATSKIKKEEGPPPQIVLRENPDVLRFLSFELRPRPRLVVGFAGETEDVVRRGVAKRVNKGCDWLLANNVSPEAGNFGSDTNEVHFIDDNGVEDWPRMLKTEVAARLVQRICAAVASRAPA